MNQQATKALLLAGLLAGSMLLMSALAGAATQDAKPEQAAAAPDSPATTGTAASSKAPVSPYVKANRERAQSGAAARAQMYRAPGPSPAKATRGQRH